MARMALIALTAIACLCFVFHVCNGRTFTHSTAEALCPGSGAVIEADIADNTTSCEVLRDLQSGPVNVYKNHPHCFCIVASSPCDSVQLKWNGITFPHGKKAQTARTVNKRLFLVKYCLRHEEASLSANGTEVYFELLDANNQVTVTSKAIINIVGSPIPPRNISVNIDCNQGVLTWLPSPTARKYSITIKCGEMYITANETVYDTSYLYTYDQSIRQQLCQISIEAINPAGRGMSGVSMMLAKVSEPAEYFLSDIDIIMRKSHAMVHFTIKVDEECPQSRHVTACAGRYCAPVDASSSSNDAVSSRLHGQLSLPQHKLLNMTVEICTDGAEEHCVFLTRQLSTHHVQSAGSCGTHGNCSLHCDFARGDQIEGCVFKFIDHDDTSQHLAPVFVHNGNKVLYELGGKGTYSMLVFDWENNQWRVWGVAVTRQITVTEKNTVDDKEKDETGEFVGIAFGALSAVIAIVICILLVILFSLWYYKRHRGVVHLNADIVIPPDDLGATNKHDVSLDLEKSGSDSAHDVTGFTVLSYDDDHKEVKDSKTNKESQTVIVMKITTRPHGQHPEEKKSDDLTVDPILGPTDPIPGSTEPPMLVPKDPIPGLKDPKPVPKDPIPIPKDPTLIPKDPTPVPKDLDIVDIKDTEKFLDSKEDNDSIDGRLVDDIDKETFVDPVLTAVAAKNIDVLEIDKGPWKPVAEDQSGAGATTESGTTSVQDSDEFLLDKHRCNTSSTKRGSCHTGNRIVGKIVTYSSQLRSRLTNTTHEETGESVTKSASKTLAVVGSNEPAAYSFGPNVLPKEGQVGEYSPVSPSEEQTLDTSASMIKEVVSGRASTSLKVAV